MADFSNLSLSEIQSEVEEDSSNPFSGLTFQELSPESEGISSTPLEPRKTPFPTIGDLDSDEKDGFWDFIQENSADLFTAGMVRGLGSAVAFTGKQLEESADDKEYFNALAGGDSFDKFWETLQAASPIRMVGRLFASEATDIGKELFEEGTTVRQETAKDIEAITKKADTLGEQIAVDVLTSAGATAPATALAPLGALPVLTGMVSTAAIDTTNEALEHDVSFTKAKLAGFLGGTAEAALEVGPLHMLFSLGKGKNIIKDTLKFLAVETGTEVATTALQDLNAKVLYNPDLTLEEAVDNLVRTAMSAPFSAGLQAGGMRALQGANQTLSTAAAKGLNTYFTRKAEDSPAPFTPFDREVVERAQQTEEARTRVETLQQELAQIDKEFREEAAKGLDPEVGRRIRGFFPKDFRFNTAGPVTPTDVFYAAFGNLHYTENGKKKTINQLNPGQVVGIPPIDVTERLRAYGKRTSEKYVKEAMDDYKKTMRKTMATIETARKVISKWVQKYSPDMKIAVTGFNGITNDTFGAAVGSQDGVYIIRVNPRATAKISKKEIDAAPYARGFETPLTQAHEFGHTLVMHEFTKQPQAVQDALTNDWKTFLSKYLDSPISDLKDIVSPEYTNTFVQVGKRAPTMREIINHAQAHRDRRRSQAIIETFHKYLPSFPEFVAHRMARSQATSPETREFYKSARDTLEKFYHGEKPEHILDKNFNRFLDRLSTQVKLDKAKADYARKVKLYKDGIGAMKKSLQENSFSKNNTPLYSLVPPGNGEFGIGEHWDGINKSVDKYNRIVNLTAGLTHISDMNTHIPGIPQYRTAMEDMWRDKSRWTHHANEIMKDWLNGEYLKNAKERENFANFLFEADRESERLGRKLDREELVSLAEQFEFTPQMFALANKVWGMFTSALNEIEASILNDLRKQMQGGDMESLLETLDQIQQDFAAMRNRNYMPHSRFGRYTVTGYSTGNGFRDENGHLYLKDETVFFGTYSSEAEAKEVQKALQEKVGDQAAFGVGVVDDSVRELIDMPPALAKIIRDKLNLDPDQIKQLTELQAILAPGQSFRKQFIKRKSIPGYSTDAVRVFSDYMQKFAGHLSRIKHVPRLEDAIKMMETSAQEIRQKGGNTVKREKLIKWYKDHLEYMVNPGNELAKIRAIGFIHYLGFNLKAALVNGTQIFLTTYPYLAQQYNDVAAGAAISKAIHKVTKMQFQSKDKVDDHTRLIDELVERGIVDESLATELAALAEGGFLSGAPGKLRKFVRLDSPENTLRIQKFFEYGALMFQAVEKMNRRITAVAAYDLAKKAGMSHADAVNSAHEAIVQTQFEYARFNRPRLMRGALGSNIFMFWQYMTNMLYFLGQNRRAGARYMILMFLLAGLEGLPGASNVIDLLDGVILKLKEIAGWKDPKKGAREYLREAVIKLDDAPILGDVIDVNQIMNGYGSNILGMFDLSASLSMGRISPLPTEWATQSSSTEWEIIGSASNLSGAMVNIPLSIIQATFSDNPDTWKRTEMALPSFAKGLSQMTRFAVRGEETDSQGVPIREFNWPHDAKTWAELVGRGAGFQLSSISHERERRFQSYDNIQYWTKRHNAISSLLNYGVTTDNPDMISEAMDRAARYNDSVPFPEMEIQTQSLARSLRQGQKKRLMRELGLPERVKHINLQDYIFQLYPAAEETESR